MASKYRKKQQLPENFYPLLEDYSREVLRDQPQDIVEFSYLYFKAIEEGTIDQFNYPRKGKNIPPPREEMLEDEQYEGEEAGEQEEELQLYDEHGQPQKFYDENGNEIPFEEVQQFMMQQQQQYGQENEYGQEEGEAN